jgi:hypothetical protein
MIPSKAIAAVASSALRNYAEYEQNVLTFRVKGKELGTYLHECIILFIIALHGKDRVPGAFGADLHLLHLLIEEVRKVLFVHVGSDTANIESAGLAG